MTEKKQAHTPTGVACAGCGRDSSDFSEYDDENPVQDDGTYADDKFVCTECYVKLIHAGLGVGEPRVLQRRAKSLSQAEGRHP